MKFCTIFCYVLCFLQFLPIKGASNICIESNVNSCGDCITLPGCAWCSDPDYADNPNLLISRCDTPENLMSRSDTCNNATISNPKSSLTLTNNSALSNVGESAVGSATQMKPQVIDVKLRPGDPVKISFSFKQAEDYPVDLYYLLDLSQSMENDLESLRALGQQLGERMQNITRDFRLGFGSFVDKTVMPYISTVDSKLLNPCSAAKPCVPTYSFHNDLPLTKELNSFVESVNNVTHSSNLDNPEGGLDAMMQAIVCQDDIKWREKATHLLVYSTDATFHYAGDGKLGGIVFPNDGHCYLNNLGHYTKANEMDYPSIGHLVRKITEHKIQPIFAVTEDVITTYEKLQKMIPKSVVGQLTEDSSNIINLIQKAYNDLKGQILIEVHAPPEVNITNKISYCTDETMNGLNCDSVKLGEVVNFTFSLSSNKCLDKPVLVQLQAYGYDEVVNITVNPLCECECPVAEVTKNCSGHGSYECGACVCETGFSGLDCSCDLKEDAQGLESYLVNCTDPSNGNVCNNRGICQCGNCLCQQEQNRKIDGTYCECDNTTCDRVQGKICNDAGKCVCGKCACDPMWAGNDCACSLDTESCYDRREKADPTKPCNGNGQCECGFCKCNTVQGKKKFRGEFCETKLVACEDHKDCIQCLAFGTGALNDTETCKSQCSDYNVTLLGDAGSGYVQECRYTDETDDCTIVSHVEEFLDVIMVDVEPKICTPYANPLYIILGIIAAIVGIGLAFLLIWKLYTSMKDAREFSNFQKESQNPNWQKDENPIFKKATSTFRNPMYTGGKPSSHM